jgi:hypothetical protein
MAPQLLEHSHKPQITNKLLFGSNSQQRIYIMAWDWRNLVRAAREEGRCQMFRLCHCARESARGGSLT